MVLSIGTALLPALTHRRRRVERRGSSQKRKRRRLPDCRGPHTIGAKLTVGVVHVFDATRLRLSGCCTCRLCGCTACVATANEAMVGSNMVARWKRKRRIGGRHQFVCNYEYQHCTVWCICGSDDGGAVDQAAMGVKEMQIGRRLGWHGELSLAATAPVGKKSHLHLRSFDRLSLSSTEACGQRGWADTESFAPCLLPTLACMIPLRQRGKGCQATKDMTKLDGGQK